MKKKIKRSHLMIIGFVSVCFVYMVVMNIIFAKSIVKHELFNDVELKKGFTFEYSSSSNDQNETE